MSDGSSPLAASAPRYLEVLVGLVAGALGLPLAVIGCLRVFVAASEKQGWTEIAVGALVVALSYFVCVTSWRLLTGRGRQADGGLMSPFMIRTGGVILALGAMLTALLSKWGILHAFGSIGIIATSFALARVRRHKVGVSSGARSQHVA